MLAKIALKNVKRSIKDYAIYFITISLSIAIFYMFNSIDGQSALMKLSESKTQMIKLLVEMIKYLSIFVACVMGFLIIYANNYLIKRRSKELGLYLLLGIEKRKISTLLLLETFFVGLISLGVGLLLGVFIGQLFSLLTVKLFMVDMARFQFVFSTKAFVYAIICFFVIFFIVAIFNVVALNKAKLINLLSASKKNEKLGITKWYFSLIFFILACLFLFLGYWAILHNRLRKFDLEFFSAFGFTILGTIFFYLSFAGFMQKLVSKLPSYFKRLNMFVFKEINKNINSNIATMVVICLLLASTLVILSSSFSLKNLMNESFTGTTPYDCSFVSYTDPISNKLEVIHMDLDSYGDNAEASLYYDPNLKYQDFFTTEVPSNLTRFLDKNVPVMGLSTYNDFLLLQKQKTIELKDKEILLACQSKRFLDTTNALIGDNLLVFNENLIVKESFFMPLITSAGTDEEVILVLPDEKIASTLTPSIYYASLNYKTITEDAFLDLLFSNMDQYASEDFNLVGATRIMIDDFNIGFTGLITFVAVYLSIVFLITCAAILAIQSLSNISDSKRNYELLLKLGIDKSLLTSSLFKEILIYFLVPLVLAVIHCSVGIYLVNSLINEMVHANLLGNILLASSVVLVIYGGYLLATFISSRLVMDKNIVH